MRALIAAAFSLGLAASVAAAPADQPRRPGKCSFKVDGKVIFNGKCDVQLDPDEPTFVKIYKAGGKPEEWIAYAIDLWGTWNHWHQTSGTNDYPLGSMTRKGNCWHNKRATLCAEVSR